MEIKTCAEIMSLYYDDYQFDFAEESNANIDGKSFNTVKWVRVDDVTNELFRFRNEWAELMIRFQTDSAYDLLIARELLLQMDEFILTELTQSTRIKK